jgi:hypothetical protein
MNYVYAASSGLIFIFIFLIFRRENKSTADYLLIGINVLYQFSFQLPHINSFSLDFYSLKIRVRLWRNTIACASAKAMATRGRLCNDFSPL